MNDYLLKVTADNGKIRAFISNTTNIVTDAKKIHNTSVSGTAAFGRLLTATSLMGSMMKNKEDLITINIKGNGPLKGLTTTSDFTGNVKGYVFDPDGDVPLRNDGKIDVASAVGLGTMSVIIDIGLKEPFIGQVDLFSGEIAEDIAYYYSQSEQIPTAVSLGVLIDRDLSVMCSGGFIIQLMPDAEIETIEIIESKIKSLPPMTTLLNDGKTLENILDLIFDNIDYKINEKKEIKYFCNCSRDRVLKALLAVGIDEIENIIKEDKKANLHCHFCQKDYNFDENELIEIVNLLKK